MAASKSGNGGGLLAWRHLAAAGFGSHPSLMAAAAGECNGGSRSWLAIVMAKTARLNGRNIESKMAIMRRG